MIRRRSFILFEHLLDVVQPRLPVRHMAGEQSRLARGDLVALDRVGLGVESAHFLRELLSDRMGTSNGLTGICPMANEAPLTANGHFCATSLPNGTGLGLTITW